LTSILLLFVSALVVVIVVVVGIKEGVEELQVELQRVFHRFIARTAADVNGVAAAERLLLRLELPRLAGHNAVGLVVEQVGVEVCPPKKRRSAQVVPGQPQSL
jgi:hypothetical protein